MRRALAILGLCLVAGCAGHRPYAGGYDKNLSLRSSVQSGMRAAVDVYSLDGQCRAQAEGRVALDEPRIEVGLPQGRASLLVFEFTGSSFLGAQRSSMTKRLMLTPRPGRRYEARVEYRDNLYNVELRENREGSWRTLEQEQGCFSRR